MPLLLLLLLLLLPLLFILILSWHGVVLTLLERLVDGLLQQSICLVEVVVDNNPIVGALLPCILHLLRGHGQPLLHRFGGLCSSTYQPLFESRERRWGDKDVDWVQGRVVGLDEFHTLCVDVEDGTTGVRASIGTFDAFGRDIRDSFCGGAVAIAAELGMFEEGAGLNEVFEFLAGDVVVGLTANLAWSRVSCSVWRCGKSEKDSHG